MLCCEYLLIGLFVIIAKEWLSGLQEAVDVHGVMTKDLALSIYGKDMKREHYVTT